MKLGPSLSENHKALLTAEYSVDDVRKIVFGMQRNKSPGSDGFSVGFYQDAWEIVGSLVQEAVLGCLNEGKLLREINNTVITLVPKVTCPDSVSDYRLIACCNVIYKDDLIKTEVGIATYCGAEPRVVCSWEIWCT